MRFRRAAAADVRSLRPSSRDARDREHAQSRLLAVSCGTPLAV
jgi:hypothetical protein